MNDMVCSACGTPNRVGRKFCSECGTVLAIACSTCGAPNEPGEKFCGECGSGLSGQGQSAPTVPAASAAFVREGPSSERRLVTVLFADLMGFTALSETRDAEEVRELLTRYFDTARDVIDRYGGVVEKFIGDAVMAVWGTPVAHEDDAERAVRAALELVDAVSTLGASAGTPALTLRAGVLSGEAAVTVGATGQGMVAGDIVNTASRLQSAAEPGTVLVGRTTFQAAARAISFTEVGALTVKGKEVPVEAWRAERVVAGRQGSRKTEQLEPPFVGRDEELRLLKELFHATARESRPRLASVMGIGGIGKSRLAWEFFKYIDGFVETVFWHEGHCPAYGEGVTFWALGEMVRMRARIIETEDATTSRAKLSAAVQDHVLDADERHWIEPRLAHLLGLQERPPGDRDELFAAWRSFFEHVSRRGPTVMLFEDLHWADPGLVDFIEHILEWARAHPIFIVTLARPELMDRRPGWGAGQRNFTSLFLEPLTDQVLTAMLEGLVQGLPASVTERIVERSEGVPLYTVETLRMLLDQGHLVLDERGYRAVGPIDRLDVPQTLHSLIASRLDALEPGDRSLLQDASVLGKTFTLDAVAGLADEESDRLEPRLQGLVRREMLTVEADARSPERGQYGFVQSLIREVAYATLSRRERELRHVNAARHFEALDDGELAGVIASHYLEAHKAAAPGAGAAELAEKARASLVAASRRAESLGATTQALSYLEQALAVTDDEVEQADLWEQAARAALVALSFEDAERYASAAIAFHKGRSDDRAARRVQALLGRALLGAGRVDPAIDVLEKTLSDAVDLEGEAIDVAAELARAYMLKVDERSITWADRAIAAAERAERLSAVADALVTKGTASHLAGRSHEGLALVAGALDLADRSALVATQLRAYNNISFILAFRDPREGLRASLAGLELARKVGSREWELALGGNACDMAFYAGEWAWAKQTLAELDVQSSLGVFSVPPLVVEAMISGLRGDLDSAASLLNELRPLVEASTATQDAAMFHIAEAWLALAAGDTSAVHATAAAVARSGVAGDFFAPASRLQWHAAIQLRDKERGRTAIEGLRSSHLRGPWRELMLRTMAAGMAAMEGRRDEAVSAYIDVARSWRERELLLDLALTQLEFITLIGVQDLDARAAADEARAIFEALGAKPFLARFDGLSAGAS